MFLRHTTANENVSCEQRLRQLSSHDSRLSIFRGDAMCWRILSRDENVRGCDGSPVRLGMESPA